MNAVSCSNKRIITSEIPKENKIKEEPSGLEKTVLTSMDTGKSLMIPDKDEVFVKEEPLDERDMKVEAPRPTLVNNFHTFSKRKSEYTNGAERKRRKSIDLEAKMAIIMQHENGKCVSAIARDFGLTHSTISTILKDKQRIKEAVKGSAPMGATIITKKRQGPIHEMEKLLMTWIEDHQQKRVLLSFHTIQLKARSIFESLKMLAGEEYTEAFTASYGWFQRFKRRFNLHNVRINGEAASSDISAAEKFQEEFNRLIATERYLPEQIFNVDEASLFWKRMPERTYIHQEAKTVPGFKAFKDRVTLLLGGNVAGFKLKPFCIYHTENPLAFKHISKHALPVYYRSNRKAWMTQALFEDWFLNCFIPEVREYCLKQSIPYKIVLILDNAPCHPPHLDDLNPDIKIVYLPPDMTSILQPMEQGTIAIFKAYYVHSVFVQAIAATEGQEVTLRDFWKSYNILQGIKNICAAWEEVSQKCMSGVWKKCLRRYVNYFKGFENDEIMRKASENIVRLARTLELEVDVDDVGDLVELVPEELSNEDLIKLEKQKVAVEEKRTQQEERSEEETTQKKFTVKGLAEAFALFNQGLRAIEDMDMNVDRFAKFDRQLQECLRCYRKIYDEKKRQEVQLTQGAFSKRGIPDGNVTAADTTTPAPSTSSPVTFTSDIV